MQDVIPPHVRQAVDEAWASSLERQACAGRAARAERTSAAETGVFVVHRAEELAAATEGRMMANGKVALIRAHLNNIGRYQRLLKTRLTDVERDYITTRLSEERAALQHHSFNE